MADLMLRWFLSGRLSEYGGSKAEVQGSYRLDQDYKPVEVYMRTKVTSTGRNLIVDINDDGESIFSSHPTLPSGLGEHTHTTINPVVMREGSIVTLDIDQVSNTAAGEDLTVILYLDKT